MLAELTIFVIMLACAVIPFVWLTRLVRGGRTGAALTVGSVIGGALAISLFAAGRPFGVDPVQAMGLAMLLLVPALLGCLAGGLLGWLLRRRDDRRV